MHLDPIVLVVDMTENLRARFFERFKNAVLDQIGFEPRKETFNSRVINTAALCRHRLAEFLNVNQAPKLDCCVLAAAMTMNDLFAFERGTAARHLKLVSHQLHRHSRRYAQPVIFRVKLDWNRFELIQE